MRALPEVFQYTRHALGLVWSTSRPLTIALATLTLAAGVLPAAVAFVGALIVDAVVVEPFGAHPSYAQGYYDRDNRFYIEWDAISREASSLEAWLDEWVYGLANRHEYVEKMGAERMLALRPTPAPSGSVDYGEYR